MVLVGRPSGAKDWDALCRAAVDVLVEEGAKYQPEGKPNTRRGPHQNVSGGYSFGGGQTVSHLVLGRIPGSSVRQRVSNFSHSAHNEEIVKRLCEDPNFRRLAGFVDGML